jgi:hypothetical protein
MLIPQNFKTGIWKPGRELYDIQASGQICTKHMHELYTYMYSINVELNTRI